MSRRSNRGKILAAGVLAAVLLAGCASVEEPKVIGEKQEEITPSGQESGESDSEINTQTEETGGSVREQVQAPERYQAEVTGDNMVLTADAPVMVPEVKQASVKKAAAANFTEEEYQKVREALARELGLEWKDADRQVLQAESEEIGMAEEEERAVTTSTEGVTASGSRYELSYRIFQEGQASMNSLMWLSRLDHDGRNTSRPPSFYEQGKDPKGQPAGQGAELEAKAVKLLEDAGLDDYRRCKGRWRESYYSKSGNEWSEAEYCTSFTPVVDGISYADPGVNLLGNAYENSPYIEVYYRADGTLNQVKIIGKNTVQAKAEAEEFLLPFEAVHQLFEQYCRDYLKSAEMSRPDSAEAIEETALLDKTTETGMGTETGTGTGTGITGSLAHVKVKNVKLEYACVDMEDNKKTGEQELIPVWSFYGSIEKAGQSTGEGAQKSIGTTEYWTFRQEPEGLILSIRADDGQILADMP